MAPVTVLTTTHKADGLSVFCENPKPKTWNEKVSLIYGTNDGGPINFGNDADIAAFEGKEFSGLTPKEGSVVLTVDWTPGAETALHRNMCLDLAVVLQGEIELILDSGETKMMKTGDILLHRATMHGWKNHSTTETARLLFVLLPGVGVPPK